jgi:ABC-type glycerol-3-phosphate transport system substrate-binding protein
MLRHHRSTTLRHPVIRVVVGRASARVLAGVALLAFIVLTTATSGAVARQATPAASPILVWTDSVRLPAVKLYQKTHPNVALKIVVWDGDTNGPASLQTKLNLFNRVNKGWPDVVFSQNPDDISFVASPPYNFATPLNSIAPRSTLKGYPPAVLALCTVGGKVYCLKNDLAQNVLWYNAHLMKQFGYKVPATWEQFEQLGLKLAQEHPGYIIGALGKDITSRYLAAARCPIHQYVGAKKLLINVNSPRCLRVVKMLDRLLAAGAVTPLHEGNPDFNARFGQPNKVLMLLGGAWYGEYVFHQGYHTPKGQLAAAPPPRWASEPRAWTGESGGGIWIVSRHAADPRAAAAVASWLVTSPRIWTNPANVYPAYKPAADAWLKKNDRGQYFAGRLAPAFKKAANEMWAGFGYVPFSAQTIWASTAVPAISNGSTVAAVWPKFGNELVQQAKINGYQVVER